MSIEISLPSDVADDNGLKTKKASSSGVSKSFSSNITNKKRVAPGDKGRGVVFIKNIPHGFYENEMEKFFTQFGAVTRVRLSRSKRTGQSKGYGYVEFLRENTAKVVAETMKDYLMFRKRLMCKFVPKSELHANTFRGWQRPFSAPKASQIDIKRQNKPHKTPKAAKLAEKRLKSKNAKRMGKIASLGVNYELPG